jgi:hypothetical protein
VAVEGDACAHQSVPSFVKGATKGDELVLRANPDSDSKLLVCGVESLPGFGVLLFQVPTFCAEYRRQLDRPMAESFHADSKMNRPVRYPRGYSGVGFNRCPVLDCPFVQYIFR